jgi:hypothetical protein
METPRKYRTDFLAARTIYSHQSHQTMRYDWIFVAALRNQRSKNNGPDKLKSPKPTNLSLIPTIGGSFPGQRAGNDPAFRYGAQFSRRSVSRPCVPALNGEPLTAKTRSEGCSEYIKRGLRWLRTTGAKGNVSP